MTVLNSSPRRLFSEPRDYFRCLGYLSRSSFQRPGEFIYLRKI